MLVRQHLLAVCYWVQCTVYSQHLNIKTLASPPFFLTIDFGFVFDFMNKSMKIFQNHVSEVRAAARGLRISKGQRSQVFLFICVQVLRKYCPVSVGGSQRSTVVGQYGSGSSVLMTKIEEKKFTPNFFFLYKKGKLAFGLQKGRPNYRIILHPSNDFIQHFKT
jgi:hypothetical protein